LQELNELLHGLCGLLHALEVLLLVALEVVFFLKLAQDLNALRNYDFENLQLAVGNHRLDLKLEFGKFAASCVKIYFVALQEP